MNPKLLIECDQIAETAQDDEGVRPVADAQVQGGIVRIGTGCLHCVELAILDIIEKPFKNVALEHSRIQPLVLLEIEADNIPAGFAAEKFRTELSGAETTIILVAHHEHKAPITTFYGNVKLTEFIFSDTNDDYGLN